MLLVRCGRVLCGISLAHVIETLRPLAVSPIPGGPAFIRGAALVRGVTTPVVDLRALLSCGEYSDAPGRFVTVRLGNRSAALAVDSVDGVRRIHPTWLGDLPPLLREADRAHVERLGVLDGELLLVLQAARLVPEETWARMAAEGKA